MGNGSEKEASQNPELGKSGAGPANPTLTGHSCFVTFRQREPAGGQADQRLHLNAGTTPQSNRSRLGLQFK